ncbi:MAG: hypothetical protein FWD26_04475 [Treponema sp.]|nr:hypothetical protein [Treponema sp.]
MKKLVIIGLVLLFLAPALFAEDAKVMPSLVGRLTIAPNFTFATGAFNNNGEFVEFASGDSIKVFNLGFALEFGIISWITAAVQWAPGWTIWSDVKPAFPLPVPGNVNTNGVADLFIGAKFQIIGETAPVKNNMIRLALAPGVLIPLPGPDFEEEAVKIGLAQDATISNMDKHAFAVGGRFFFDFVFNKMFFINLFNETIVYPIGVDLKKTGLTGLQSYGTRAAIAGAGGATAIDIDVNYGYKLTFEVEPVFSAPIGGGIILTAGVPVRYVYSPAPTHSVSVTHTNSVTKAALEAAAETALDAAAVGVQTLNINPNIAFFFTRTPLPLEFKFQYNIPVWGMNEFARHTAMFQIKAFFAFGKR